MTSVDLHDFTIPTAAFDLSLIPAEARKSGSAAFREAVSTFLQAQFRGFGGRVSILVDDLRITVSWTKDAAPVSPLDRIVGMLQQGKRAEAVQLLELLLSRKPDDVDVLYNLGVALSEAGRYEVAEKHLRRATELAPRFVNALIALGVALAHQQKDAEAWEVLESAVELDPLSPLARSNFGVTLLKLGRYAEAAGELRRAVVLRPDDQTTWMALGDALRLSGQGNEAAVAYAQAMNLNPHNESAEVARRRSSELAMAKYDGNDGERHSDAVRYCVIAIKEFAGMPRDQLQALTLEIALLGSSGFDVNSPARKYRLKSRAGEFSGLELVCRMYVGLKQIDTGADAGFDLSKEYAAAKVVVDQGG